MVEDVKELWKKEGVGVWEEEKEEEFKVGGVVLVRMKDWGGVRKVWGEWKKG